MTCRIGQMRKTVEPCSIVIFGASGDLTKRLLMPGLYNLAKARRTLPPYESRRVYFDVKMTPAEATYVIRDEGGGFDPSVLPDPSDPVNLEKVGGRGILLIRSFMDLVQHNETGNTITMTKRCDSTYSASSSNSSERVKP